MTDQARVTEIQTIIERLRVVWFVNPELRLGQLIENLSGDTSVFYVPDETIADALRAAFLADGDIPA